MRTSLLAVLLCVLSSSTCDAATATADNDNVNVNDNSSGGNLRRHRRRRRQQQLSTTTTTTATESTPAAAVSEAEDVLSNLFEEDNELWNRGNNKNRLLIMIDSLSPVEPPTAPAPAPVQSSPTKAPVAESAPKPVSPPTIFPTDGAAPAVAPTTAPVVPPTPTTPPTIFPTAGVTVPTTPTPTTPPTQFPTTGTITTEAPVVSPTNAPRVPTPESREPVPSLAPTAANANTTASPTFKPTVADDDVGEDDDDFTTNSTTTWDIIMSRPDEFGVFIATSEAVGFDEILQAEDVTRTVFVPNDEAFSSIVPSNLLVKYLDFDLWSTEYIETLLFCHEVAMGEDEPILEDDMVNGTTFMPCVDLIDPSYLVTLPPPTISKQTMPIDAKMVEMDLVADNGVVHVVSQVLTNSFLRFDLVESMNFNGQFTILLELIELSGLLDFVQGDGPFTIFAPTDDVFDSYGDTFIMALKLDLDRTRTILLNHIVADVVVPCCLGERTEVTSMAEFPLVLDNYAEESTSDFTVNGVRTVPTGTDILTSNAKLNTITDLLFLPTIDDSSEVPSDMPSSMPSSSPVDLPAEMLPTVWDVIKAQPEKFASFIQAAEAVNYDTVWQTATDVTIFAPNEGAFASILPFDLLEQYLDFDVWTDEYIRQLMDCHDVGATLSSTDLLDGTEFSTCLDLYDPEFSLTSPPPAIEKATFTAPAEIIDVDLEAETGLVHVINQVMTTGFLRFDAMEAVESLKQFTILLELIEISGLADYVAGDGPFTLFAPTDTAFEALSEDSLQALRTNPMRTRMILMNHIVPDIIIPTDVGESTFISASGFPLNLSNVGGAGFDVNEVQTVPGFTNLLASNSKISATTDVLLPPIFGDLDNVELDMDIEFMNNEPASAP
eukprot:CAMPEP_0113495408 /NCGR_PEP_ID=MMETSP0014_2-20120614/29596_1 /TAXON_ID=2857 /ORGANISM="Nitzschia sp." /LENGTH=888 /DNA_ID=CAMNT_0000389309 /DNA_START=140 /DNA_END=2806 /DNA_ORIENTATION=- /assembly_acc=CAM_ASM_000159